MSSGLRRARGYLALTLRWMLIASIVLLAFIGFLYMTRGTAVRHVHSVGADGSAVAPGEPQFPTSVAMLTGAALEPGNRVELALNGDGSGSGLV